MEGPQSGSAASAQGWGPTIGLGLAAAVLYGATLCPTVSWYDSAEFSASAASLRVVPHPPGYPLYTLVGHVFSWLPGEAAWGLNVMSVVFGVLVVVLMHRVSLRCGQGRAAAVVPPVLVGLAPSVWANAVVAEVYTPGLAFLLAALLLCLHARQRADARLAWVAAWVAGLGLGVHMSVATWGLGFGALVVHGAWPELLKQPRPTVVRWGLLTVCATLLGALVFLLIPFGPFDAVAPLGPWEDTFHRIWARTVTDVQGGVFQRYFKPMPAGERLQEIASIFASNLGLSALLVSGAGLAWAASRHRMLAVALVLGAVGNVGFFYRYDVPDLDVFLLPAVISLALLAGFGVEAASRFRPSAGWALAAVVVCIAGGQAWARFDDLDRSMDRSAREYGEDACRVLPRGAVLVMTSRPDEWRLYGVLLYMHEAEEGCAGVEFWGRTSVEMVERALDSGRAVYSFVEDPRFGWAFAVVPEGPVFRVLSEPPERTAEGSQPADP